MSAPKYPPRIIAWTIADLAAERTREAYRYLVAHRALLDAGIPRVEVVEALEAPGLTTDAVRATRAWADDGGSGLLLVHGIPGVGKTHAAVLWALDRHRAGESTFWVAAATWGRLDLDQQRQLLTRATDTAALVIDDIGAGATSGKYLQEQFEGTLLARMGAGKPTIVLSNANAKECAAWVGPRIWSRLANGGGRFEARGEDLRGQPVKLDKWGRSALHIQHGRIIEAIGAELVAGEIRVGGALELRAKREGYPACRAARELLGLTTEAILEAARERVEEDRRMIAEVSGAAGLALEATVLTWEAVYAEICEAVAERRREDQARRVRECYEALAVRSRGKPAPPQRLATLPPTDLRPADARAIATRLGFSVRPSGSGFDVLHERRPAPGEKRHKPSLLAQALATEADAWTWAATLGDRA